MQNVATS